MEYVILDVGGVGYKVFAPLSVLAELPPVGSSVRLFTYTYVKEDALALYGFSDLDQQTLFEMLLSVSGVGPKVSLNILSALPVEHLADAIARDDHHALVRIPGIGSKIAQRIVIELKEKTAPLAARRGRIERPTPTAGDAMSDLVDGLVGLGYKKEEATDAVEQALAAVGDDTNTAALVRQALKLLTKR